MRVPAGTGKDDNGDEVLVLRGLRASTVHKDITLRAIGESGMASAAVPIPTFCTLRELTTFAGSGMCIRGADFCCVLFSPKIATLRCFENNDSG